MAERKGCGYLLDKIGKVFRPKNEFTSQELAQHLYGGDPKLANSFGKYLEDLSSGKITDGFEATRNENGGFDIRTDIQDPTLHVKGSENKKD